MANPVKRTSSGEVNGRFPFFERLADDPIFSILEFLPRVNVEAFGLTSKNHFRLSRKVMPRHREFDSIAKVSETIDRVFRKKIHPKVLVEYLCKFYGQSVPFIKPLEKDSVIKPLEKGEDKRIYDEIDVTIKDGDNKYRFTSPFEKFFARFRKGISYENQRQTTGQISEKLQIVSIKNFLNKNNFFVEEVIFNSYKQIASFRKIFDKEIEANIKKYGIEKSFDALKPIKLTLNMRPRYSPSSYEENMNERMTEICVNAIFSALIDGKKGNDWELKSGNITGTAFSKVAHKFEILSVVGNLPFQEKCWESLKTLRLSSFSRVPNFSQMKRLENVELHDFNPDKSQPITNNTICLKKSTSLKCLKITAGSYFWNLSCGFPKLKKLSFIDLNYISKFEMEYFPKLKSFMFNVCALRSNFNTNNLKDIFKRARCDEKYEIFSKFLRYRIKFSAQIQKIDCVRNIITKLELFYKGNENEVNVNLKINKTNFPHLIDCELNGFKAVTINNTEKLRRIKIFGSSSVALNGLRGLDHLELNNCEKTKITRIDRVKVFALSDIGYIDDCSLKIVDIFALRINILLSIHQNILLSIHQGYDDEEEGQIVFDENSFSKLNFSAKHLEITLVPNTSRYSSELVSLFENFPRIRNIQSLDFGVVDTTDHEITLESVPKKLIEERLVNVELRALRCCEDMTWVKGIDKSKVECIHLVDIDPFCESLNLTAEIDAFTKLKYLVVNKMTGRFAPFEKAGEKESRPPEELPEGSFQELLEDYFCCAKRIFHM